MVFLFLEQMHHPNTFILFCRSVPNKWYDNMSCEVSKKGIENYIDFWPKSVVIWFAPRLPSGSPGFESDRRTEILRSLSFN